MTRDYKFFKQLTPVEEETYRTWAKDNYVIGEAIDVTWHPIVIDECMVILMGDKKSVDSKE